MRLFAFKPGRAPPKTSTRLKALLTDYPPFPPRHLGYNGALGRAYAPLLTLEQCRENLEVYKAGMDERLMVLGQVLAELGIDLASAYSDTLGFVTRLHPTMLSELPPLYRPAFRTNDAQEISNRSGPDIVLSFMADLAMLEADILMKAKPGCFLGLNLNRGDRLMSSYRRPCLIGLGDSHFPGSRQVYYLEETWFGYYANMDDPTRLTRPDNIIPPAFPETIGGTILMKLDRDVFVPGATEETGPA